VKSRNQPKGTEARPDIAVASPNALDIPGTAPEVGHDLQEPIRNISVYGELLGLRYGQVLDAEGMNFLATIIRGARRMEMLLRDLRSYAQSGGGENGLQGEVQMAGVLAKALADLSAAIDEAHAEVSHGELPTVWAHEIQLEQVFQNLISNAIKYRKDDETPRIFVGAARLPDHWIFSVRDNGIGIAAENQKRIFGIFKRLHGSGKYAGNGIGLAICQRIVERNGGRIWVESDGVGKGGQRSESSMSGDGSPNYSVPDRGEPGPTFS
jgi:light-regulated signal transduction histidine kinase (bacteriophytochrome)